MVGSDGIVRRQQKVCCDWRGAVCGHSFFLVALVVLFDGTLMPACSWARSTKTAPGLPALTLDVSEPSGCARSGWPMTAGVPFPPGVLQDPSHLRMRSSSAAASTLTLPQSRVLSRWPDGSVRWILLDWQTDLAAHQQRSFRVELDPVAAAAPAGGLPAIKLTDQSDRIAVDTGPLRFTVPKNRFALLTEVRLQGRPVLDGPVMSFLDVDGQRAAAQAPISVAATEHGPLRTRIELRGHYSLAFDYVIRIDAFAGQPFVRVLHTFEQHAPQAYVSVRQLAIDVPMRLEGNVSYRAGKEQGAPWSGTVREKALVLLQEDNDTLRVDGAGPPGRAAGWLDVHDATHGLALASRFFWQEYPQSFAVHSTGLTYNMWPPEALPAKVGMGASKTHEMVFYFHGNTPPPDDMLAALTQPLLARVDPSWTVATGALPNSVAPGAATTTFLDALEKGYRRYQDHAETERWDDSGQVHCPDPGHERPRRGFFGMLNWGDWNFPGYHDTTKGCDAWGNLEYDMTQVLALAYAATGERAYGEGMVAAARHFMDVDRIAYCRAHPEWTGVNHPKNPLHFSFELGGPDLGHTWTEGLLSYYYLTGDERGLEAARGIADYLVRRLRGIAARINPRQWGWPQIALIATYEATGNRAYLTAAQEYADKGMAVYPPDKVEHWKMGILAEALSYTHAVTQDAAIRDWLVRYAAAVVEHGAGADPRFFPAVAYVGRITGKEQYTRAAATAAQHLQFGGWGKPFTVTGRLGFRILSLTAPGVRSPRTP
jgi:hypothetical protein